MAVSAIILAGGRATRMGGADKGLVTFCQKPLVSHIIERLAPQADEILINANREIESYKTLGYLVLQDEIADFAGPLAGMQLGLKHAAHEYVLTAPCDTPLLPLDLAERMLTTLIHSNADIAVAISNGDTHPVFCLCKKTVLPSLNNYLQNGGRKVSEWQQSLKYVYVDFSDCNGAFANLNTAEDLSALAKKLETASAHGKQ